MNGLPHKPLKLYKAITLTAPLQIIQLFLHMKACPTMSPIENEDIITSQIKK